MKKLEQVGRTFCVRRHDVFAFGRKTAAVSQYVHVLKQRMLMGAVK